MAKDLMSTVTNKILVHEGFPWGKLDMRVAGAAELYPGYVCTTTGNTSLSVDVSKPDALGDNALGVVGTPLGCDLDTVLADNKEVPVYMVGSGSIVYCYAKASCGALKAGDIVIADAATDNGFVIPWTALDEPAAWNEATSQTELDKVNAFVRGYVGRVWVDSADSANDRPILVQLI